MMLPDACRQPQTARADSKAGAREGLVLRAGQPVAVAVSASNDGRHDRDRPAASCEGDLVITDQRSGGSKP